MAETFLAPGRFLVCVTRELASRIVTVFYIQEFVIFRSALTLPMCVSKRMDSMNTVLCNTYAER
jgi:hypothetical protein